MTTLRTSRYDCFPWGQVCNIIIKRLESWPVERKAQTDSSTTKGRCYFLELPDEMLLEVTKRLDVRSAVQLMGTCRKFRDLIKIEEWLVKHLPQIYPILFYEAKGASWVECIFGMSGLEESDITKVAKLKHLYQNLPYGELESAMKQRIHYQMSPATIKQHETTGLLKRVKETQERERLRNKEGIEHLID